MGCKYKIIYYTLPLSSGWALTMWDVNLQKLYQLVENKVACTRFAGHAVKLV